MKAKIITILFVAFSSLVFTRCSSDGMDGLDGLDGLNGKDGKDAAVYYSDWITPSAWLGASGDWYFNVKAPDLTADVVESGVILGYVWLSDDIYEGATVRPLPAYALDTNWSFLVHEYGYIEFTSDMILKPYTTGNKFRFIAIPGTIPTLKSGLLNKKSAQDLKSMSYTDVCKYLNIPE